MNCFIRFCKSSMRSTREVCMCSSYIHVQRCSLDLLLLDFMFQYLQLNGFNYILCYEANSQDIPVVYCQAHNKIHGPEMPTEKYHENPHYVSAILCFRRRWQSITEPMLHVYYYQCRKVSVVKQGYPVLSVRHGKVCVGIDQAFEVGDHDSTGCLLTRSVLLVTDIPESNEGYLYNGKACVHMKVSVFDHHYAAKDNSLLTKQNNKFIFTIVHIWWSRPSCQLKITAFIFSLMIHRMIPFFFYIVFGCFIKLP